MGWCLPRGAAVCAMYDPTTSPFPTRNCPSAHSARSHGPPPFAVNPGEPSKPVIRGAPRQLPSQGKSSVSFPPASTLHSPYFGLIPSREFKNAWLRVSSRHMPPLFSHENEPMLAYMYVSVPRQPLRNPSSPGSPCSLAAVPASELGLIHHGEAASPPVTLIVPICYYASHPIGRHRHSPAVLRVPHHIRTSLTDTFSSALVAASRIIRTTLLALTNQLEA